MLFYKLISCGPILHKSSRYILVNTELYVMGHDPDHRFVKSALYFSETHPHQGTYNLSWIEIYPSTRSATDQAAKQSESV